MQVSEFYKAVKDPFSVDMSKLAELQQLVKDFPYFQSAHVLLSVVSKKWDSSVHQQSLKKTAILSANRAHLFELINKAEANTAVESPPHESKEALHRAAAIAESEKSEIVKLQEVEADLEAATARDFEAVGEKKTLEIPAEEKLENEIARQVVTAFVEKELIGIPELQQPRTQQPEPESFGDWLNFLKKNNGQPYENIEEEVNKARVKKEADKEQKREEAGKKIEQRKKKNLELIDKIIEKNPGHIRVKEEQKFYAPDIKARESLLENEHLVTETLARIYALQGNVNKAVRAYEILSLKYPQKSAYFASLIQKLKNNQ